ncbi:MAG: hypothetical protein F4139_13875 [Gemmatimonadetes bacterium]|nr:hypothetical protein [Gemmatimonadota bacterium]MYH54010.1 hypothetical protein [Gemmatimonadota bacterium]MYK65578.1 hypothetical protein [Gemmatimonadota bacterium]
MIAPADTLLRVGDTVRYQVTVLDQDSAVMDDVPDWASPLWTTPVPTAVYMAEDGRAEAGRQTETEVRVSFAGLRARTRLRVNPDVLTVTAAAYTLTQGVQNVEGTVPLIAGRDAFLRVFVTGDQPSFYQPRVRASFFHGTRLAYWVEMDLDWDRLPTEVEEGLLERSFNAHIPGGTIRPGATMVIEVDREGVIPHSPESRLRIPAHGGVALDVRRLRRLDLTVVPVVVASDTVSDQQAFDWAEDLTPQSEDLRLARSVLPIGDMSVRIHEGVVTNADLTTGIGWGDLLEEITLLRVSEGSQGYYYGAVSPIPGSRWNGLAVVAFPVAVGIADGLTLAHELGHNQGLQHAPCGGTGGADEDYPYEGGITGVWGYDLYAGRLVNPFLYKDVMGYCSPAWVSDYHFRRAMVFRENRESELVLPPRTVAAGGAEGRTLLLWGSTGDRGLELEPAFMTDLPVTLPEVEGPYRLEGFGPGGQRRFLFSFVPRPMEFGGGSFLFAVPYDPSRDGALERVVLSGPEGHFVLEHFGAKPMAMITDRSSGRVRGVLRDWKGGYDFVGGDVDVVISEGLPR